VLETKTLSLIAIIQFSFASRGEIAKCVEIVNERFPHVIAKKLMRKSFLPAIILAAVTAHSDEEDTKEQHDNF
jgi:hypothetical protein